MHADVSNEDELHTDIYHIKDDRCVEKYDLLIKNDKIINRFFAEEIIEVVTKQHERISLRLMSMHSLQLIERIY